MTNLEEAVTADYLINEIRLAISSGLGQRRVYILVEGIDDLRIYPKLFIKEMVVVKHTGGKVRLMQILQKLILKTNRVIGIMDADFSHLNNNQLNVKSLFLTDKHDIEMTMLSFPEVVSNIFSTILPGVDTPSMLQQAMQDARFISYVRWFNDVFQCRIEFDGSPIAHFIIKENKSPKELLMILNSRSKIKNRELNMAEINKFMAEKNTGDYYNLCNGHDVLSFLTIYLKPHTSRQELFKLLCAAFNVSHFVQTQLYHDIFTWQTESGFSVLYSKDGSIDNHG